MSAFNEKHAPTGRMVNTSQADEYRNDRPHASTVVCDRPSCREAATFWVQGVTGETAVFRPYRRAS